LNGSFPPERLKCRIDEGIDRNGPVLVEKRKPESLRLGGDELVFARGYDA